MPDTFKYFFLYIFLVCFSHLSAQNKTAETSDKILIIPGEKYEAGWLHEIFFGTHWRSLWTTPLEAKILNLKTFKNGITPYKKGGGFQTKSLRFKGTDGREWKFRSLDKDPSKVLPDDLRESLISDIIRDQISSANPLAPMIVVPLLNAVGVFQAEPELVYLPDSEELGEFRNEFGGLAGFIEIHPEADKESFAFQNATKIESTFDLLHRLEKERDEKVDSKEFLKARLMDIFFGDWDRHTDQWRWARFDLDNLKIWKPIPRDRDQAFAKFDGLLPSIAAYYTPQLVHFGYNYPQVEDITWSGRFLDRRYLSELTRRDWDSITAFVFEKITYQLIEEAVRLLPESHYKLAGKEIETKLKMRRDNIFKISDEYYHLINNVVDIYGTNKEDYAEVIRMNDDYTEVSIFKKNEIDGEPLYHKIFDNNLTNEIRIYLLDNDDRAIIKGNVDNSPLIRIIAGDGEDELIDSSRVDGYLFSFLPINDAENKTGFYDSGKKTKLFTGSSTFTDDEKMPEPKDDFERYEPQIRDRGYDWIANPIIGYNSDDGFLFGGGPILKKFNFRLNPYEYWMSFTAAYATLPKSYRLNYEGIFYNLLKNAKVEIGLAKSELNLTKYFGYGNETRYSKDLEKNNFYRLEQELFHVRTFVIFNLLNTFRAGIGLSFDGSTNNLINKELISYFPDTTYGLGTIKISGIHLLCEIDTRDNISNPFSGIYLNFTGSYYPKLLDNKNSFTKAFADIRGYFSTDLITNITLALRAGGGKIWGSYPFHQAFFMGGKENLRGYSRERFSGDSGLFGQAELRAYLTKLKFIIIGDFGFLAFAETGRVYTKNTDSKRWHPSFGGGFWMSFLQRTVNLSFTLATSPETTAFYFGTSLMF
jgi:hypothetical protein